MAQMAARQHEDGCEDQRSSWSHGTFFWNELMTRDVERAKRYYGDTIGWSFEPMQMTDGRTYWCAAGEAGRRNLFPRCTGVRWRAGELDVLSRRRRRG